MKFAPDLSVKKQQKEVTLGHSGDELMFFLLHWLLGSVISGKMHRYVLRKI